ncbi:uncharacterized protein LOC111194360 [Astyanax mexicanus]|uniref:uncharacterized protein LOC111194360 n=1 Tax=Astyanax mexicanus TaxID=7994 RepID=UPI0020CAD3AA|nr:uncharacterized protein LOC111194360 [Astyanax mexicanus]
MNAFAARQYCRQNFTDLASVRNQLENQQIFNLAGGEAIWIGLYRTRLWSDQSNSIYENWKSGEPNNMNGNEHCTTVWFYYSGMWNDSPCNYAYPFVCYRVTSTTIASTDTPTTSTTSGTPATTTNSDTTTTTRQLTTTSDTPTNSTTSVMTSTASVPVAPTTTTQLTTKSVTPNATTISVTPNTTTNSVTTSTAFVPVAVMRSRVKITSARNLTQSEIENFILNNLHQALINRNLSNTISVRVTRVMKIT